MGREGGGGGRESKCRIVGMRVGREGGGEGRESKCRIVGVRVGREEGRGGGVMEGRRASIATLFASYI